MQHYDGSFDPKKFLSAFKYTLDNRGYTRNRYVSYSLLEEVANDWFNTLPKNTISLFMVLGITFLNRFFQKSTTLGATVDILNISQ